MTVSSRSRGLRARLDGVFAALGAPTSPRTRFYLLVWLAAMLLVPVYTSRSGKPQFADFAFLAIAGLVLFAGSKRLYGGVRSTLTPFWIFTGYGILVNAVWYLSIGDKVFVNTSAFLLFNAMVLFAGTRVAAKATDSFVAVCVYASVASLLLQTALVHVLPTTELRHIGTFNNPNQLAYFALCSCTILVMAGERFHNIRWMIIAALACGAYLSFIAVSRAGLAAILLLAATFFVRRPALVFAGAIVVLALLFVSESREQPSEPRSNDFTSQDLWTRKLDDVSKSDVNDYLQDRGIDRLVRHPLHVVLGAGEGGYRRFHAGGLEMHSSLGTIVFCYGIVGAVCFGTFLYRAVLLAGVGTGVYLLPAVLYGLFHQGLRFRILWITFAVMLALGASARESAESHEPESLP